MNVSVEDAVIDGYTLPIMIIELSDRAVISIPTQIGCPVKCDFCISKNNDFVRNLSSDELISLANIGISKVALPVLLSFTGEGEPLLNIKNINTTMKVFEHNEKVNAFRICTSGVKIQNLKTLYFNTKPIDLQFSCHSPFNSVREKLIPLTADIYQIVETILLLENKFREVAFNYVLMKDINDSERDLKYLKYLLLNHWIVKLNPLLDDTGEYKESDKHDFFERELKAANFKVKRYHSVGSTIKNNFYSQLTYERNLPCGVTLK